MYQPTFSAAQLAACQAVTRRQSAPQAQVYRAKLALLLHEDPARDNVALGTHLGKHENWVRYWRKIWATEGSGWRIGAGKGASPLFPPQAVATVKALACEVPTRREQPLSRYSTTDLTRLIAAHPDAPPMSASTIWRILAQDARKPWRHRSWLYPRDRQFASKAGRVLDLYAGWWDGQPLSPEDCLLSADEKTSIQARGGSPPRPRPDRGRRCAWNTSTNAAAHSPISPPGMCGAAASSGAARRRPASAPSGTSSRRCCGRSPTAPPARLLGRG